MQEFLDNLSPPAFTLTVLGTALAGSLLAALIIRWTLTRLSKRDKSLIGRAAGYIRRPLFLLIPALTIVIVWPLAKPGEALSEVVQPLLQVLLVVAVTWLAARLIRVVEDAFLLRFPLEAKDNIRARKMHTQVQLIRKVVVLILCVLAFGVALMSFEKVRQLGTTLLASAGVLGIILGFAAQKSIATVIAGIQMAITQPIRIDDVLIVEGEWGRVEEITLTYVVVRIWDKRRLVVPVTYFLEKPFQNWTRTTAEIIGTVHLFVDYDLPLEPLRTELARILETEEKWDGDVSVLQIVNATDKVMELRALVSARDAGDAWDLRCSVRERLLRYIRREHPASLPRVRIELERLTEPIEEMAGGTEGGPGKKKR